MVEKVLTAVANKNGKIPLFIDPNADPNDALPGGMLYEMRVKDVVAAHRYDALSVNNNVVTSAMRLKLDPVTTIFTVYPTAANNVLATIRATDRERNEIKATIIISVISCNGVRQSYPCNGVTVGTESEELPTEVSLSQNYPNPFNPSTTINYALPQAGNVSLVVYDMLGRKVSVLIDELRAAGNHTARFDTNTLPNGAYIYCLIAGNKVLTKTMMLVK